MCFEAKKLEEKRNFDVITNQLLYQLSYAAGICYLDEISETSPAMQSKLLRVLQNREIKRIGSNQMIPIHARIVASSNKDLKALVRNGQFREDLFYRLNGITIQMPPLRERREDLPELIHYFLKKYSPADRKIQISEEAYAALLEYDWPGNIRQLEHVIQRAVAVAAADRILTENLNIETLPSAVSTSIDFSEQISLEELEKRYIRYVYLKTGRNKVKTADVLGIDRKTLYSKLARYGIEPGDS
jgi:transcriptional regulator with PAS, ATPase and Fis domain